MEATDLRPLGNREAAGKESADRPAKVAKALKFIVRTTKTFSLLACGGRTVYKVIAHGDRVDIVSVGTIMENRKYAWISGDGFEYEVKLEYGKVVAYTPPCTITFTNKELEEMSFKQLMYKLATDQLEVLFCALAKAGISFEDRLAFEQKFKQMLENDDDYDDEVEEDDDDDDDDDVEDTGDLGDLGNPEPTVTYEQGTTA